MLPGKLRGRAVRLIGDSITFENVWKALDPGQAVPGIDFKLNLVAFVRNTQFYNRIRIGMVTVKSGVAEELAMEAMSAIPIQDKVSMSLAVVPRKGIKSIRTAEELIVISDNSEG